MCYRIDFFSVIWRCGVLNLWKSWLSNFKIINSQSSTTINSLHWTSCSTGPRTLYTWNLNNKPRKKVEYPIIMKCYVTEFATLSWLLFWCFVWIEEGPFPPRVIWERIDRFSTHTSAPFNHPDHRINLRSRIYKDVQSRY